MIEAENAQFRNDHRKARELSRKRDELDTAIIDVWRQHDDRVKLREKKVLKEVRPIYLVLVPFHYGKAITSPTNLT